MHSHLDKNKEQNQSVNPTIQQKQNQSFQFGDNRPEALFQLKLQEMANDSFQVKQAGQLQAIINNDVIQTKTEEEQLVQKKENNTGLPDNLKSGIENLSGYSMDDVKVHYNSDKPAQLNAHAYAQGTDIHLGSGQEKHLPHEAWHVVQQKQGRVKPTMQMKGKVNVNDDKGLEREADVMGERALKTTKTSYTKNKVQSDSKTAQLHAFVNDRQIMENYEGIPQYQIGIDPTDEERDVLADNYYRYYESVNEFQNHIAGNPVKCGLNKKLGLWYRLPFPSAVQSTPQTRFFLIGENHGYSSISYHLGESNQANAKVLTENDAHFRDTQMGVGEGDAANLAPHHNDQNKKLIELGFTKVLHAFASIYGVTADNKATSQPAPVTAYQVNGNDLNGEHRMLNNGQLPATPEEWGQQAQGKQLYRNRHGILYFLEQTPQGERGVMRPKPQEANPYNQANAMTNFINRPEVRNAMPEHVLTAFDFVRTHPDEHATPAYKGRYNQVYYFLKDLSENNINLVYPHKNAINRAPEANVAPLLGEGQHAEFGMKSRNTVMLAGLFRAIQEGGYIAASLGSHHVQDIQAWNNANQGQLNIEIITYNDYIRNSRMAL